MSRFEREHLDVCSARTKSGGADRQRRIVGGEGESCFFERAFRYGLDVEVDVGQGFGEVDAMVLRNQVESVPELEHRKRGVSPELQRRDGGKTHLAVVVISHDALVRVSDLLLSQQRVVVHRCGTAGPCIQSRAKVRLEKRAELDVIGGSTVPICRREGDVFILCIRLKAAKASQHEGETCGNEKGRTRRVRREPCCASSAWGASASPPTA